MLNCTWFHLYVVMIRFDLAKATYEHLIDLPLADCTDGEERVEFGFNHWGKFLLEVYVGRVHEW